MSLLRLARRRNEYTRGYILIPCFIVGTGKPWAVHALGIGYVYVAQVTLVEWDVVFLAPGVYVVETPAFMFWKEMK